MVKKFLKEMPKIDHIINAFCLGFSLLIAVIVAAATYSSGADRAVSFAIGLAIVCTICGYRFNLLWKLFKDSLNGDPRKSTSDYIVSGLTEHQN